MTSVGTISAESLGGIVSGSRLSRDHFNPHSRTFATTCSRPPQTPAACFKSRYPKKHVVPFEQFAHVDLSLDME
jgi:hypothetical protein